MPRLRAASAAKAGAETATNREQPLMIANAGKAVCAGLLVALEGGGRLPDIISPMKRWDAFISHASEDKAEIAAPLAEALRRGGVKVWLDRQELKVGDSLREKIDEGLSESRFGIVVLSPHFFQKGWPKRELNGLMALEEGGQKVILPVWHAVSKVEVAQYSPILADRLAANTADGMRVVTRALLAVIFDPQQGSPSAEHPTLARRLAELLDGSPQVPEISSFLDANPLILGNMGARYAGKNLVVAKPQLFGLQADFAVGHPAYSMLTYQWQFFILSPIFAEHLFEANGEPALALKSCISQLKSLLHVAEQEARVASLELWSKSEIISGQPEHGWSEYRNPGWFHGTIFAGRRHLLTADDQERLRHYNQGFSDIPFLTTYDRLIEFTEAVSGDGQ